MALPNQVQGFLRQASLKTAAAPKFTCEVFGGPWDEFVEEWLPRIHTFLFHALGPFGKEPLPEVLPITDGLHIAGATASFDPTSGQVRIHSSVDRNPGKTLEKLTHELTHASLALFPEGDCFWEEGVVDYSVWVMAHAPVWGEYRDLMIESAQKNIDMRRERAMASLSDWDIKRWAGGHYAALARGPYIVAGLRMKKAEGNLTWY